ncbi:MAG: hypothetical protein V3V21_05295 [Thermoplasmata archaeon]
MSQLDDTRKVLAACVREHLPEEWDGEHKWKRGHANWWRCDYCKYGIWGLEKPKMVPHPPCPGPDYTRDTDVLLRILQKLSTCWNMGQEPDGNSPFQVEIFTASDGTCILEIGPTIEEALLAAILAALEGDGA